LLVHLKQEIKLTKNEVKEILSVSSETSVKSNEKSFESQLSKDKKTTKKKLFLSEKKITTIEKDKDLSLNRSRMNLSDNQTLTKMSALNDNSLLGLNISKDSMNCINILDELEPSSEAQLICVICENIYCKCFENNIENSFESILLKKSYDT